MATPGGEKTETVPFASALPLAVFGPILAVHFLGTLGWSLVLPVLVFIVTDLGGASWTYGVVGATYAAFQLVGAPALGRWSDHTGRRPVLVASQAGTLAAWVLFFVALSIPKTSLFEVAGATLTIPLVLVFVARALDGATGGNISVANAYVADLTRQMPGVRQRAFGRMGMAASLGFVIGPGAAGILGGTSLGLRLPIAVAGGLAALTTVGIVFFLREPGGRCPEGPPDADMVGAGLGQQAKRCDQAPKPHASMSTLMRPPVPMLLAAIFLIFLAFNFFYAGFPVHAYTAYGWDSGKLGMFFAVISGAMVFSQGPFLSHCSKFLSPRWLFATGMGLLTLSLCALQLEPGPITFVGAVLFALGNGLSWPTIQARLAEVGGDDQGSVQGVATSAGSAASIGGLIVGGALYPVVGGALFFVGAGIFALIMLLTPFFFPPVEAAAAD